MAPALAPTHSGLRSGADQALKIHADAAGVEKRLSTLTASAAVLKGDVAQKGSATSCRRRFWLTFFFDGTGNNMDADLVFFKHSNVARLYRAHKPTSKKDGVLSVYIPGVGTYFPEIGDKGGSTLGLGCGAMGDARLDFAVEQFDDFLNAPLKQAKSAVNAIEEINIAVFGFSRGAALARAFVAKIMEERCVFRGEKWRLKNDPWPVRFRFLGLFDTVASVGVPMSSNTTGAKEAYQGDLAGMISKRLKKYDSTRPQNLAFSITTNPGADPAPGINHGHDDWGGQLEIHRSVEDVRHFIAAHEIRNSFPLDSVSVISEGKIKKPSHFFETIYPGAHSDVGGGYAPGEGGRSFTPKESLSLIPLHHMFDCALRSGVPMLVEQKENFHEDFVIDKKLRSSYISYAKSVGSFSTLGEGITKHMALYYAWKFRLIKRKLAGDKVGMENIREQTLKFSREQASLARKVSSLEKEEMISLLSLNALTAAQEMQDNAVEGPMTANTVVVDDAKLQRAREKYRLAVQERLRVKAQLDAIPNMSEHQKFLDLYEAQLLRDARAILDRLRDRSGTIRRNHLRPHYKALLEAYENEFEKNSGLKDEKIIDFFDNYVHDSLPGFGKDATLPSDPRVVYLGGDEKYRYASVGEGNMPNTQVMIA